MDPARHPKRLSLGALPNFCTLSFALALARRARRFGAFGSKLIRALFVGVLLDGKLTTARTG